jgi:hypothetical protein
MTYDPLRWLLAFKIAGLPLLAYPLGLLLVAIVVLQARRLRWGTREASIVAAVTAAILASNYALLWLPNIKLMDLIVFATGLRFGSVVGGVIGVFVWMIYGSINPYGFDPITWLATMTAEAIYGIVGGRAGILLRRNPALITTRGVIAILGVACTAAYDFLTNLIPSAAFSYLFLGTLDWSYVAVWLIGGLWFSLVHVASNGMLFFVGLVPLNRAFLALQRGVEQ